MTNVSRLGMTMLVCCGSAVLASGSATVGQAPSGRAGCQVSGTERTPSPPLRSANPTTADWYINEARTIWAGWLDRDGSLPWSNEGAYKTFWVRPTGTELVISGRRLDAPADPLKADIPEGYTSGFQIVGMHFPTAGCWEVTALAGDETFQFVLALVGAS